MHPKKIYCLEGCFSSCDCSYSHPQNPSSDTHFCLPRLCHYIIVTRNLIILADAAVSIVSIANIESCCSATVQIINYCSSTPNITRAHNHYSPRASADTTICLGDLSYMESNERLDGLRRLVTASVIATS